MFTLLNVNNKHPLMIKVESPNGDSIQFNLKPLKAKRNKDELNETDQFTLLNEYLEYKGREFKLELYRRMEYASVVVDESVFDTGLTDKPKPAIHAVLDMFDLKDIEYFIKDIYKIQPPPNLKESFDKQIEEDGLGTRVQTYIIQDYYELASITLPVKAIVGLLSKYISIKESIISTIHKEFVVYELFLKHPIFDNPAIQKIRDWAKILIDTTIPDENTASVTVIEKRIPEEDLPDYIVAVVILQKLSSAAIINDTQDRNVITRIYNYIINKLRVKADSKTKIRDKKPLTDTDLSDSDKESILESYRIVSDLTIGTEVELDWYVGNMDYLIRDMGLHVNMSLLEDILSHNECFKEITVTKEQIILAGYLFKKIIDPRSLEYLSISSIINLLSLGYTILWETGHRELAMLINAKPITEDSDVISVNNVVTNIRIDPVLKDKLEEYYPYKKQVNKTKTISVVEEAISELSNNFFKHRWVANAPDYCIKELYGEDVPKLLPGNLKNLIAKLIIDVEEKLYDQ